MADLIERKDALAELIALRKCNAECSCENDIMRGKDIAYENAMDFIARMPAVNRWIPCSERLPENGERVLVRFRSGTVHIAVWYGDYDEKGAWKVTSQFPTKLYRTDTIPKWMPMPEIPELNKTERTSDE